MYDKTISNYFVLVSKYFIIALYYIMLKDRQMLNFVDRNKCAIRNEGRRKSEMIRMVGGDRQIK